MSPASPARRVPVGVPSGGQFAATPRAEAPRLVLVPATLPGLDDRQSEKFARIDALLVDAQPLTALDQADYDWLCSQVDAALDPEDRTDRVHLPDCIQCGKPWGSAWRCRVCCDLYDEPMPLRYRRTMHLRQAETVGERPGRRTRNTFVR